jgi:enamine deaminase RidA (YjgF/YER057c/UK114 family)
MEKQVITAPNYNGGLGGRVWSPGLKLGPWLYLSGITAVDYSNDRNVGVGEQPSPMTPGAVDPEAQWRQVLTNIKNVVEGAGGTMADVIQANVFVTDMHFYFEYEWVRREFFVEPYPVCTALEVTRLVHPDWVVEIECVDYIDDE